MTGQMIRLCAKNDINGNPRRVYVLLDGPRIIGAWDEGYEGYTVAGRDYREMAYDCPSFETTPSQYKSILKNHAK